MGKIITARELLREKNQQTVGPTVNEVLASEMIGPTDFTGATGWLPSQATPTPLPFHTLGPYIDKYRIICTYVGGANDGVVSGTDLSVYYGGKGENCQIHSHDPTASFDVDLATNVRREVDVTHLLTDLSVGDWIKWYVVNYSDRNVLYETFSMRRP